MTSDERPDGSFVIDQINVWAPHRLRLALHDGASIIVEIEPNGMMAIYADGPVIRWPLSSTPTIIEALQRLTK